LFHILNGTNKISNLARFFHLLTLSVLESNQRKRCPLGGIFNDQIAER
jgi:hypothetical protein